MTTTRKSDTRYQVVWYSHIPTLEDGSSDFDRATEEVRYFPNAGLARAFARKVAARPLPLRVAQIRRQERRPVDAAYEGGTHKWWWKNAGEVEEVTPDRPGGGQEE